MNLVTVSDIARELKSDRDKVSYAVRKAKIEPVGRAGLVRLFPLDSISIVRNFLKTKRVYNVTAKCG